MLDKFKTNKQKKHVLLFLPNKLESHVRSLWPGLFVIKVLYMFRAKLDNLPAYLLKE